MGNLVHFQNQLDHFLNLLFFGLSVAAHGLFDLLRFIFGDVVGSERELLQNGPSGLRHLNCGLDVFAEKNLLNRHRLGFPLADDCFKIRVNLFESYGEGESGRGFYASIIEQLMFVSTGFDDAKSDRRRSRIKT